MNWYFVCHHCNAKWFAPLPRLPCPRCGQHAASHEEITPPWIDYRKENNDMLQIKGLSKNVCFVSGSGEDVVDVKFKDGSFEGSISWDNLLKVIKRKAGGRSPQERDSAPASKAP